MLTTTVLQSDWEEVLVLQFEKLSDLRLRLERNFATNLSASFFFSLRPLSGVGKPWGGIVRAWRWAMPHHCTRRICGAWNSNWGLLITNQNLTTTPSRWMVYPSDVVGRESDTSSVDPSTNPKRHMTFEGSYATLLNAIPRAVFLRANEDLVAAG